MNKLTLIKLLQDFGIITNNRLETSIHLALVLPFIAIASVIYGAVWLLFMNDSKINVIKKEYRPSGYRASHYDRNGYNDYSDSYPD